MRRPDALAWRDWARRRHSTHLVLKGVVLLVGAVLVVAGIAMLVLPGPGWAAIFLGLVVLGSEFDSAARVRHALHEKLRAGWSAATAWRRGRRTPEDAETFTDGTPAVAAPVVPSVAEGAVTDGHEVPELHERLATSARA
ncbi:MAG: PGPGW domain-containing protein [Candidatus Nanopelagicales bacterium]